MSEWCCVDIIKLLVTVDFEVANDKHKRWVSCFNRKEIIYVVVLHAAHGVGFSRAGLSVREARDDCWRVEDRRENVLQGILIEILRGFGFGERVVKEEIMVFNVFRDAVDSQASFVHANDWIVRGDTIDFARFFFGWEERALPNDDGEFPRARTRLMWKRRVQSFRLNQPIELVVDVPLTFAIQLLPLQFLLLLLHTFLTQFFTALLHFLHILN